MPNLWWDCRRKVAHKTIDNAWAAIDRTLVENGLTRETDPSFHPYKCRKGDHWHIGHTPQPWPNLGGKFIEQWELELGRRAAAAMWAENSGSEKRRLAYLERLLRTVEKKRLRAYASSNERVRAPGPGMDVDRRSASDLVHPRRHVTRTEGGDVVLRSRRH